MAWDLGPAARQLYQRGTRRRLPRTPHPLPNAAKATPPNPAPGAYALRPYSIYLIPYTHTLALTSPYPSRVTCIPAPHLACAAQARPCASVLHPHATPTCYRHLLHHATRAPTPLNPKLLNPKLLNPKVLNPKLRNPKLRNPKLLNLKVPNPTALLSPLAKASCRALAWCKLRRQANKRRQAVPQQALLTAVGHWRCCQRRRCLAPPPFGHHAVVAGSSGSIQ